jgi:hypothetical protein
MPQDPTFQKSVLTKTQYYKPWELLPREEERIKTQIAEAEAAIEREIEECNRQHPKEGEDPQQGPPAQGGSTNGTSEETVGEPRPKSPSVSRSPNVTTNSPTQASHSNQDMAEKHSPEEHSGEVVVEAEEDTVIY